MVMTRENNCGNFLLLKNNNSINMRRNVEPRKTSGLGVRKRGFKAQPCPVLAVSLCIIFSVD